MPFSPNRSLFMQRDRLLISEIVDAAQRIVELTDGASTDVLDHDRDRRDALLWSFTVLGEACNQVSESTKRSNPHIEWAGPASLRNRLVHNYWQVNSNVLLSISQDDVPRLLVGARLAHLEGSVSR